MIMILPEADGQHHPGRDRGGSGGLRQTGLAASSQVPRSHAVEDGVLPFIGLENVLGRGSMNFVQEEAVCPICRDLVTRAQDNLNSIGELLHARREAMGIGAENLWTALSQELERWLEAQDHALKVLVDHKDGHEL